MNPTISVILCTYERPRNLRMALASLAGQRDVKGKMEVVVADDGSRDETSAIVEEYRRNVDFPILFTTHPHSGFCPGRSRNEGATASSGEYLLFLDGDCLAPPDLVAIHLAKRRPGVVRIGDCARMTEEASAQVTEASARDGSYLSLVPLEARRHLYRKAWKIAYYRLLRRRNRPSLVGNHFALARSDYERMNGFDENYVGWGNEDDDFGNRLRRAGLALKSILFWTAIYHLWHPPTPSFPATLGDGANVPYYLRGFHLLQCGNGQVKRAWRDLRYDFRGSFTPELLHRVIPHAASLAPPTFTKPGEVEVLFAPTSQRFTGRADCNVLVLADPSASNVSQVSQAHLILCRGAHFASLSSQVDSSRLFGLEEFPQAMHYLLRHERSGASAVSHAA